MFMRKLCVLGALCALLLAGCDLGGGGGTASSTTTGTTTADSTSTATIDPSATSSTTPTAAVAATPTSGIPTPIACGKNFPDGIYGYIGDMLISFPHFAFLSYLGVRLPNSMPAGQPFAEAQLTSTLGGGVFGSNPAVYAANGNPSSLSDRGGGFVVTICNSSTTASHTLSALGAQITGFTSAAGMTLDAQVGCDTAISAAYPPMSGCGGSLGPADTFEATWPAGAGVGTTVTLAQTGYSGAGIGGSGFAKLPITLKHGGTYTAFIGMNYPGQPGNYTFQFGMQVDAVPLSIVGTNSPQLLMATGVHQWSGLSCFMNATWDAVVKAHPQSFYVCPA